MGWDRKQTGPSTGYFYESVRTPTGVKKIYHGRGAAGHEAAAAVEKRHQERERARATIRAEREVTSEADRLAGELRGWAEALSTAWLVLTGHHQHHGQWRHRNA